MSYIAPQLAAPFANTLPAESTVCVNTAAYDSVLGWREII